ncbi:hypothetical protein Ancab_022126 [Ancistrocladus abbreviatus]
MQRLQIHSRSHLVLADFSVTPVSTVCSTSLDFKLTISSNIFPAMDEASLELEDDYVMRNVNPEGKKAMRYNMQKLPSLTLSSNFCNSQWHEGSFAGEVHSVEEVLGAEVLKRCLIRLLCVQACSYVTCGQHRLERIS